jgi:hypothetical protein
MATKPVNMACVTVGFQHYLMPADKALKVVELMQTAIECERSYQHSTTYTVGDKPLIELTLLRPEQILASGGEKRKPKHATDEL